MPLLGPEHDSKKASSKTAFRNTTRCLKLTRDEAQLLDEVATARGVPRSEWMRDVILRELRTPDAGDPVFAEILCVRLLLVNVLCHSPRGSDYPPKVLISSWTKSAE